MKSVCAGITVLTVVLGEIYFVCQFGGKADQPVLHFTGLEFPSSPRLSRGILLGQLKGTFTELLCTLVLMSFFIGINKFYCSHI